ncbi:hypothetical protein ACMFMF_007177 [Clarireedia jacksonii]
MPPKNETKERKRKSKLKPEPGPKPRRRMGAEGETPDRKRRARRAVSPNTGEDSERLPKDIEENDLTRVQRAPSPDGGDEGRRGRGKGSVTVVKRNFKLAVPIDTTQLPNIPEEEISDEDQSRAWRPKGTTTRLHPSDGHTLKGGIGIHQKNVDPVAARESTCGKSQMQ